MLISFESKKQEECSWGQTLGPWVMNAHDANGGEEGELWR